MSAEQSPIAVSSETPLQTNPRVIVGIVFAAGACVAAWVTLNHEVNAASRANELQDRRMDVLESRWEQQREIMSEIRYDLKALRAEIKKEKP